MKFELIKQNEHLTFKSRLAFARHLHSIDPTRTVKGWEMMILRYERQPTELEEGQSGTYKYSKESDMYYTYLSSGTIEIDGDKHREMQRVYSTTATTQESMAIQFDMPKEWFRQYKQIHGWRKNSVPLTNEQLADASGEDVIDVALAQARRHSITQEIHRRSQKTLLKDAQKFRELDVTLLEHMKDIVGAPAEVPKLEINETNDPYALVICPTDFHWGKGGWVDEVGETYNFEEARIRLFTKTNALINKLSSNPEKIYIGIGSDWFHVDNDAGTTTKGTPQDMCGSPAQILISGCQLAREHIDLLRQVAPVEIIAMPGNHDRMSSYALMMYLSAAYESCADVSIDISAMNRQYRTYGDNLLGFTHGDGLSRGTSMGMLMATEAKEEWGIATNHMWFHGHLHHQRMTEKDGVLIFQMPSLAGHDRYHYRSGYTTSRAGLAAYIIDKEEGYVGCFFAPVNGGHE